MEKEKKRYPKLNSAPGSLIYTGIRSDEPPKLQVYSYNHEQVSIKENPSPAELAELKETPLQHWVIFSGLQHVDQLQILGEVFHIHPVDMEDVPAVEQAPKFEDQEDYLYCILKLPYFSPDSRKLKTQHFSLFLFRNVVLVCSDEHPEFFSDIIHRLSKGLGKIRLLKADYMFFRIIDKITDHYFEVLDGLQDNIDDCETLLIHSYDPKASLKILEIKKELIKFRKSVLPLTTAIDQLCKSDNDLISKEVHLYLKDVKDNTGLILQTLYSCNDLMTGLMDHYMSNQGNQMNNVMKILTIVGSIFIPLTFVVGIYGMNLKNMPETQWDWFYPVLMSTMAVTGISLFVFMKKKRWF